MLKLKLISICLFLFYMGFIVKSENKNMIGNKIKLDSIYKSEIQFQKFEYDNNGNIIKDIQYSWNADSNSWIGSYMYENEYSKQYKCCEGIPSDIKCYPKNPNWDDNWREKRNPNYSTTKQKDNYIINN